MESKRPVSANASNPWSEKVGAPEAGGLHVDGEDAHPDEDASRHQVENQLHRAVFFGAEERAEVGAAPPNTDEQVHRQHRQLVEEKQEEQVPDHEHPVDPGRQRQQQREELPVPVADALGDEHAAEEDDAIQDDQRGRNPVEAEGEVDVQRSRQPVEGAEQLKPALVVVVAGKDDHRKRQRDDAYEDRKVPVVLWPVAGHEHHQARPGQRDQHQQKKRYVVEVVQTVLSQMKIPKPVLPSTMARA